MLQPRIPGRRGETPPEALRWGIAAGAAALQAPGTSLAQAAQVRQWVQQVPPPQLCTPG